jgi:hypothetical protein
MPKKRGKHIAFYICKVKLQNKMQCCKMIAKGKSNKNNDMQARAG